MAGGQVPPPQAIRMGAKGSTVAVLVIVFLVIGFVAGGYMGAPFFGWEKPKTTTPKTNVVVGTNIFFFKQKTAYKTHERLVGLDIDLMNEIGRRNDWNVIWQDFQDWDALLAAIKFQGVDIGASSITMSGSVGADRNASFDFSNPYYESDQAILVKVGSTAVDCAAAQCTADELANHTVAVQTLTTSYWWIQGELVDTLKTPQSMVSDFGDLNSVIQELVNGNVDWVLVDKPIAENLVAGNAQLRIEGSIETNELYGFAVADGDPDHLITKINDALSAMKADGTYATIMQKWLG